MIHIGIDPGASGAIAVISDRGKAIDYCKLSGTEADVAAFLQAHVGTADDTGDEIRAAIERVHSMPKQGVASSFKFGQSYGFLRGLLIAMRIPFQEVQPRTWQQALSCLTGGDKNVSKAKAQQLFPDITITHAIADALLIGEWLRRQP